MLCLTLLHIFSQPWFAVSAVEGVKPWQYRAIHWSMCWARTHLLSDAVLQSWYSPGQSASLRTLIPSIVIWIYRIVIRDRAWSYTRHVICIGLNRPNQCCAMQQHHGNMIHIIANRTCNTTVTGSCCIRCSRIWHDPVIFPVICPSVLSAVNQNTWVVTQ